MNPMNNPMGANQQNPIPNPYLNNYAPIGAQTPFYSQPILQPAGMVYIINSSQELSTIPTQAGLNLYWCGNENKIYIRNYVGGMMEQKEYYLSTDTKNSNSNNMNAQAMGVDDIIYIDEYLERRFQKVCGCKDKIRITVGEFVDTHPQGTYLITMRGHITCAIDGCIYDTFNPSDRFVWGAYKV